MNKLKREVIIFVYILLFASCAEKRSTKEEFAKFALKSLIEKKDPNRIYVMPGDTLYTDDKLLIDWAYKIKSDTIKFNEYLENQDTQLEAWYRKAAVLGMKKDNIEFIKVEEVNQSFIGKWDLSDMSLEALLRNLDTKCIKVYFDLNGKEYYFFLNDVDSIKGKWVAYHVEVPTSREEEASLPYIPDDLYFTTYNWEVNNLDPKTFNNFFVTLKNSTPNDFKKIQMRVKLSGYTDFGFSEIFSKVIELNEVVHSGDISRFEIHDLRGFYTGINLNKKSNFKFNAEIVDAKPRPGYEDLPY